MKNILVVDDDRNMNDLISRVLKSKLSCKVESVYNGIDAFIHLHNDVFDLIILDISMPLLHGIEILKILKEDPVLKKIPVAMMTANREKEIISQLVSLGIIDFIAKPISLDIVYTKLKDILKKIESNEKPYKITDNKINFKEDKILVAEIRSDLLELFNNDKDITFDKYITDSGLEALKYFIKEKPGVVYLGKNLPIVNEKILIKTFRNLAAGNKFKIILAKENTNLSVGEQKNIDYAVEIRDNASEQFEEIKKIINN